MADENTLEIIAQLKADAASFGRDINRAREELKKLGGEATDSGREVDRGVGDAEESLRDLSREADRAGDKLRQVGKGAKDGLGEVETGTRTAGGGLGNLTKMAGSFLGQFVGPAALGAAALKFFQDINAEAQRGAQHLQDMIDVTQKIVQVSPTQADLTRLEKQIGDTVRGGLFTEQEAGQYVFDVESQLAPTVGRDQAAQDATDFAQTSWFMDAQAMPETYGTYLGNYDAADVGTGRQFTNKLITAAQQSATSVEGFVPAARGAVLGQQAGISFDEQLAGAAAVSQAYGGRMEQVATGQAAIGAIAEREGIKSETGTWEGLAASIEKRDAEIKRNMAAVNAQTATLERQAQALEAQQTQIEAYARQVQRQREDADAGRQGPLSEQEQRRRTQEDRQLEDAMLANREKLATVRTQQRTVGENTETRKTWAELMQGEREANLYWMRYQQNREKTQQIGQMVTEAGQAAPGEDALSGRVERSMQSKAFDPMMEQYLDNNVAYEEGNTTRARLETQANIREKAERLAQFRETERRVQEGTLSPTGAAAGRAMARGMERLSSGNIDLPVVGSLGLRNLLVDDYASEMTPALADAYETALGITPQVEESGEKDAWGRSLTSYQSRPADWNERSSRDEIVRGDRAYPTAQTDASDQPVEQSRSQPQSQSQPQPQSQQNVSPAKSVANNITVNIQSVNNQVDVDHMADQLGQAVARNQ